MLQIIFPNSLTDSEEGRKGSIFPFLKGKDKYFYNIRKEVSFKDIYSKSRDLAVKNISDHNTPCFYCGSQYSTVTPGFLHDNSGYNLWLYDDWRSAVSICKQCNYHYGSSNIKYIRKVREVRKGKLTSLLLFEPEVLVPTLEPVHLHFEYLENGLIIPQSERAERTISSFALNRNELVERRLFNLSNAKDIIGRFSHRGDSFQEINPLISGVENPIDLLFLSGRNVNLVRLLNDLSYVFYNYYKFYGRSYNARIPNRRVTFKDLNLARRRNAKFSGLDKFEFSGIRGFSGEQSVNFNGKSSLIIVGENGVGKSTFLEVIKRGLKEGYKNHVNDLKEEESDLVPYYNVKYGNSNSWFSYRFRNKTKGEREYCYIVHINDSRSSSKGANKIANFLNNKKVDDYLVNWVCKTLSDLLELPNDSRVLHKDKSIFICDNSGRKNIDNLSSGYNSIMNIFGSILYEFEKESEVYDVESIYDHMSSTVVLVDEIELHLHPRFKKNIIKNIKSTFPNILFVFTTHDPMVLSSSTQDDIVLLFEKDLSNKTCIRDNLPDHSTLSSQQILSSPIFGLSSFSEGNVESMISEYNTSLRIDDKERSRELRKKLGKLGYFGNSYRELIAFSAVDAYLSKGLEPDFDKIVCLLERVSGDD